MRQVFPLEGPHSVLRPDIHAFLNVPMRTACPTHITFQKNMSEDSASQFNNVGSDSSVSTATRCGLDRPWIESR
jgi:hypothetical protein